MLHIYTTLFNLNFINGFPVVLIFKNMFRKINNEGTVTIRFNRFSHKITENNNEIVLSNGFNRQLIRNQFTLYKQLGLQSMNPENARENLFKLTTFSILLYIL